MNLNEELHYAYNVAKKHKSNKNYVLSFNKNLENNLFDLENELKNKTYTAQQSICFLINRPKKREIFAAQFRDRIVHHLYFNRTHELFEKTFIYDSYSCIKGKGTHFGIERLKHHIASESNDYKKTCYVLKLDIKGYFMAIHKPTLLNIVLGELKKGGIEDGLTLWLSEQIIMLKPTENCIMLSDEHEYEDLPKTKTLFNSEKDCGLPIGNLTSQLFSNVYLNVFDQYMKRVLKCKHYGRYVDDAYVISCDKEFLKKVKNKAREFLKDRLRLTMHEGKTRISNVKYGVEFLGAFVKEGRTYISNQSLRRMNNTNFRNSKHKLDSAISRQGLLSHYNSYNIRQKLFIDGKL